METITNQILILGLTTLIGYLAYKLKAISSENNQSLVKIIIKITLPFQHANTNQWNCNFRVCHAYSTHPFYNKQFFWKTFKIRQRKQGTT